METLLASTIKCHAWLRDRRGLEGKVNFAARLIQTQNFFFWFRLWYAYDAIFYVWFKTRGACRLAP